MVVGLRSSKIMSRPSAQASSANLRKVRFPPPKNSRLITERFTFRREAICCWVRPRVFFSCSSASCSSRCTLPMNLATLRPLSPISKTNDIGDHSPYILWLIEVDGHSHLFHFVDGVPIALAFSFHPDRLIRMNRNEAILSIEPAENS